MLTRGARKFVFLGRSGAKKPEAIDLVAELNEAGAEVSVIKGDVSREEDVIRAVESIKYPIGGVVQAAMGLDVSLPASLDQ
jgi:NAD(P)-dependent dehydrogenase (short-subunit alcohol dehydrogenase family)